MIDTPHPPGRPTRAWPIAFAVVAVVALLVGAALYVFRSLRDLPGDAVEATRGLIRELETVAEAFRRGSVETTFISYATTVSGNTYLQFATLRQTEVFTRLDQASILWGNLDLPDVVVSATAPVEYTAYLDLDDPWRFELAGNRVRVLAPDIRFNTPAIDASEIRYEVRQSSLLRDEQVALQQLKRGLTEMSKARAREQVEIVREIGRRKTEEFVANWLLRAFDDAEDYTVEVVFPDETGEDGGPLRRRAGPETRRSPA